MCFTGRHGDGGVGQQAERPVERKLRIGRQLAKALPDERSGPRQIERHGQRQRQRARGARAYGRVLNRPRERVCLLQCPARLIDLPALAVLLADRDQQLDMGGGVAGIVFAFDDAHGAVEQLVDREWMAIGCGVAEQELIQLVDSLGSRQLTVCKVALAVNRVRLQQRARYSGHDGSRNQRRQRDRHAIAPHELGGAVADAVRPGGDRLMLEMMAQIAPERGHGGIAFPRILFQ